MYKATIKHPNSKEMNWYFGDEALCEDPSFLFKHLGFWHVGKCYVVEFETRKFVPVCNFSGTTSLCLSNTISAWSKCFQSQNRTTAEFLYNYHKWALTHH